MSMYVGFESGVSERYAEHREEHLLRDVAASGGSIRIGDRGYPVVALQEELNRHGYSVPVSGSYDRETSRAVGRFNADNQIGGWGAMLGTSAGRDTLTRLTGSPGAHRRHRHHHHFQRAMDVISDTRPHHHRWPFD